MINENMTFIQFMKMHYEFTDKDFECGRGHRMRGSISKKERKVLLLIAYTLLLSSFGIIFISILGFILAFITALIFIVICEFNIVRIFYLFLLYRKSKSNIFCKIILEVEYLEYDKVEFYKCLKNNIKGMKAYDSSLFDRLRVIIRGKYNNKDIYIKILRNKIIVRQLTSKRVIHNKQLTYSLMMEQIFNRVNDLL